MKYTKSLYFLACEERVDVSLKVFSMTWVSFEDNIAVCVDKDDVGNTLNLEILVSCATSVRSQVVFDVGPTLVHDVRSELV